MKHRHKIKSKLDHFSDTSSGSSLHTLVAKRHLNKTINNVIKKTTFKNKLCIPKVSRESESMAYLLVQINRFEKGDGCTQSELKQEHARKKRKKENCR